MLFTVFYWIVYYNLLHRDDLARTILLFMVSITLFIIETKNVIMITLLAAVGLMAVYTGLSLFFSRFPNLLHKKKKQAFSCRHISHRGGIFNTAFQIKEVLIKQIFQ